MFAFQLGVTLALLLTAVLVWRNHRDYRRPSSQSPEGETRDLPLVSVLVPARNEAANIEACVAGLLAQSYPRLEVVVLDDGSADDTAERVLAMAERDPRLRLTRGAELPAGWAGKAYACWLASQEAEGEWLLFVDADTRHAPDLVSRAVAEARRSDADLLSTFPRQEIGSTGEALTVPMIYWVLFTLLPIRQVEGHASPAFAAACGQFLLVKRPTYLEIGGHRSIRSSLHDGLHLARLVKARGRRYVLVDLSDSISCRMYRGWRECWSGFGRNAYEALGSVPALIFLTLLEGVLCLSPVVTLAAGWMGGSVWLCVSALLQIGILGSIQVSLQRRFGYPWLTVALFPAAVTAFLAIQWRSWWTASYGRATAWKGRIVRSMG